MQMTGSLLVLCLGLSLTGREADMKRRVHEQAQAMADAIRAGDVEKAVCYLNPNAVNHLGGRKRAVAALQYMTEWKQSSRFQVNSWVVTTPGEIVVQGKERFAVVQSTTVYSVLGKKYTGHGVLVGVSADGGRRWAFVGVDGMDAEDLREVLPNLPKSVKLPPRQAPVVEETK